MIFFFVLVGLGYFNVNILRGFSFIFSFELFCFVSNMFKVDDLGKDIVMIVLLVVLVLVVDFIVFLVDIVFIG